MFVYIVGNKAKYLDRKKIIVRTLVIINTIQTLWEKIIIMFWR